MENVTSSIKPEVRNVWQCHHRRIDPQPQATCTKNGKVFPCGFRVMLAGEQTYSPQYFTPLPGGMGRSKYQCHVVHRRLLMIKGCHYSIYISITALF